MSSAGPPGSMVRKKSLKKEDQNHTADEIDPNDGIDESGSNGDATDHDDHDEQNDADHKSEKSSVQKKNKNQNELRSSCGICGAPAADHLHYGAFCCYSCRAFFRRSGHRVYKCVRSTDDCKIESKTRRNCKKCRYR
ncbi:estrogen receptor [Eurytemora carolleeae]|uniref:estrogen receptor n=1 Tax=Eurytemora carolleeae TaxID=1294199 RepID=UPI000C76AE0D|nr:estrogen receptor [Eurytemora carolleeae]|eukprot:XP_023338548.1 estrogen receptor-like [Eurytemora affinis]